MEQIIIINENLVVVVDMKMIVEDLAMMIIVVVITIHLGVIRILVAPGDTIIMLTQIEVDYQMLLFIKYSFLHKQIIIIDNVIVIRMNIIANDDHLMIIHKLKLNHGRN